jgi:hypothetical protein
MPFDTTDLEQTILRDIRERTGLTFRRVGGIDTNEESIAAAVLPILADWAERLEGLPQRSACYSAFLTPFAHPFLDRIIAWWISEKGKVASSILAQAVAVAFHCADAEKVWDFCHRFPPDECYYRILAKLAACRSVEVKVRDELVAALASQNLRAGSLSYIATVPDFRIRKWFEGQTNSRDPYIKALAKRATAKSVLPRGVEYAAQAPDRRAEVFSTEYDLADLKGVLARIGKEFGVKMPPALRSLAFLRTTELDRSLVVDVLSKQFENARLWLRLEGLDTVEILLLASRGTGGRGPV